MSSFYKLKATRYSIDRDFPLEIRLARERLCQEFHDHKSKHPNSNSAKLVLDDAGDPRLSSRLVLYSGKKQVNQYE
ncbi:hypothetical protein DPMN_168749 [Dreissena polymorpha]|uniref:Uncharacterized protein n=1 Tax=Dreissena polymorpha TaxID=45954 RepID=A0A9D4F746_DREPO|nr:hypothetical protein DPMN_168749 [Dreissena polymorpha]